MTSLRDCFPGGGNHDGEADLAPALVGTPMTATEATCGSSMMTPFDLGRVNVLTAGDEHVLGAVGDGEEALLSRQPRSPERNHPSGHRFSARLGQIPVAGDHVGSATRISPISPGGRSSRPSSTIRMSVKKCGSPRCWTGSRECRGDSDVVPRRRLRHAVSGRERQSASLVGLGNAARYGRAAARQLGQRAEVRGRPVRMLGHHLEGRRNAAERRDPVLLDGGECRCGFKLRLQHQVPPLRSVGRAPMPSDATWNSGETMSATSVLVTS